MSLINGRAYDYMNKAKALANFESENPELLARLRELIEDMDTAKKLLREAAAELSELGKTTVVFESPLLEVKVNSKVAQAMLETGKISKDEALQICEADTPRVTITLVP